MAEIKKEWLDIINNTPRKDVPVCYDIVTAAIGNEKAREWIKSHFAGAESMLDIYLISKAYSSRMSDAEIIKAAKEAEKSLNRIAAVINEAGNIPDDIEERERNWGVSNLAIMRMNKGMSQSQLAKASGVNVRMIQKYEQESWKLGRAASETVQQLANALGCTMEQLLDK